MADQDYKDVLNRIADGLERLTEALERRNADNAKAMRCPTCSGDGKGYGQVRCIRCGGTGIKQS